MGFHEIAIQVDGDKSLKNLTNEAGGHRIQRVPPTEKRGRVHTSTVTVSVVGNDIKADPRYEQREDKDFYVEWFSGSGAGGQHRNKHQNCCRVYHLPTGLMETRQGRKREANLKDAKDALIKSLDSAIRGEVGEIKSKIHKEQVGSGMRGDKIRTIRFQDDIAVDHETNKKTTAKKYMRGFMDDLWI